MQLCQRVGGRCIFVDRGEKVHMISSMERSMTKRVLFLAAPFKGYFLVGIPGWLQEGNPPEGLPDIIYTLRGFHDNGYEVHITLPVFGHMYLVGEIIREGIIHVHHYRLPGIFLPLVRLLIRKGNFLLNYVFAILTMVFAFGFHRRLIKRLKPDFLYQMGPNLVLGEYLRRITGTPLVYRLFGTTVTSRLRPSSTPLSCGHTIRHGIEVFMYHRLASLYVQTNDGSGGGKPMDRFGVPRERQLFVVNGVNLHNQEKAVINMREKLPKDSFLAVTTAHLVWWKGIDRTLRALPKAIELNPKLYYAIIGDGTCRKELEKLTHSLGIEDHVQFYGVVPNASMIDTLRQADVFISTIYRPQNLPNTMLEAITAGCNVISLADGSLDGFLEDGRNAILIDPNQVEEELPEALERLAKDKSLNTRLSVGIREKGKEIWSWPDRIAKEIEMIERAIKRR